MTTLGALAGLLVAGGLFCLGYYLGRKPAAIISKAAAKLAVAVVAKSDKDAEKAVTDAGDADPGSFLDKLNAGTKTGG